MKTTLARALKWLLPAGAILAPAAWLAVSYGHLGWEDRVYRVGWENDPPFQQKAADGSPTGMAVELVREAAQRGGIRLEWVWRPGSSEDALRSGQVDLWPLITITNERKQFLHISDPYVQHDSCFLVRAASPYWQWQDLAHARIAHFDQPFDRRLAHKTAPDASLIAKASLKEAIDDVCGQRADAAFIDEFGAVSTLLAGPSCSGQPLRMISIPALRTRLGVGSTFAAAAVADRIREEIGSMPAGDLTRLMMRWGYFSPRNLDTMNALLSDRRRERFLTAVIGLFALLSALALFEADRIRRQRNRIRTAEQALRESEQKLRLMADNLTEMVLAYDMNRKLTFANPAVERLTGYSIADLEKEQFICWVHPDDRSRMLAHWEGLFHGRAFQDEEYRLVSKEGRMKWATASWGPILDHQGRQVGVQGSERDITERQHAEEALRESERRFRGLLESVQLVAVMIDLNGYICFCNDYALAITGWSQDEVLGHPAKGFLDPESQGKLAELIESLRQSGRPEATAEMAILTKTGGRRWIQWSTAALCDRSGRTIGFASLGADVTEHRRLQEQYVQAQKLECVGRLAGGIAHDFNNLLVVVNGYSDLVLERLHHRDPLREGVEAIRRAGQQAATLTRQLLTFGRTQVLARQPLDLNSLVRNCERMLGSLLREDIHLETVLDPHLGTVLADPGQAEQVLMNLVLNASDAMPEGGRLVIQTSNVELDEAGASRHPDASPGSFVCLRVVDSGIGMSPKVLRHIFEPFFTTKAEGKGSGLGLATVFGIVKQSDGWIEVSSEPGKGTTFEIYLPRTSVRATPAEAAEPADRMPRSSGTVLLVEDQEDVRRLTEEVLKTCGYEVLTAGDGDGALVVSRCHQGPIHLMLSDIIMPGMNGGELAQRIRSERPDIKVLFMSGYAQRPDGEEVIDPGAAWLPKPFTPRILADKVREVLEPRLSGRP